MRNVRDSVFETNSSSVHSLTIKRNKTGKYDYNLPMNKNGFVPLMFSSGFDFGWGPAEYRDTYSKLNYLACMAFQIYQMQTLRHNRQPLCSIPNVLKIKDIKKLERVISKKNPIFRGFFIGDINVFYIAEDYYDRSKQMLELYDDIDHQSCEDKEYYLSIDDFLKENNITLENFLFNPYVVLNINNDNG